MKELSEQATRGWMLALASVASLLVDIRNLGMVGGLGSQGEWLAAP